ncbi:MAG: 2-succinyl-5-enolpyruvyl-6-hydroxy-3-cyclohexene-1-carboxylic-acid synthase [Crocinitomicaceae bacterium]|nr:2-succinyl-5-enolpyruvyl-6-hydroxy-3-cyclohexene-1-carboxylic-acid synthase [Crocinitomicaceae bacterium]
MTYRTSKKKSVHYFVEKCVSHGLKHVVISPGSRNAPLSISFDEHPEVRCYTIHDERVAGFVALGMMQMLQQPVAVVCTSGSAVVNYFPAVAEAFYQCLPLLVISADRPEEWINHGDGQTIMQREVFGKHVRSYLSLSDHTEEEDWKDWDVSMKELFAVFHGDWKGPAHINFAFEEPLYETEEASLRFEPELHPAKDFPALATRFKEKRQNAGAKLVLVGQMDSDPVIQSMLEDLARDTSVVVLVENTSNLYHQSFIHCIDRTIESISTNQFEFCPEILVTLGGAVVSKRIKNLFRNWPIQEHWKVGVDFPEMDTYRLNRFSLEITPLAFLREARTWEPNFTSFSAKWKGLDLQVQEQAKDYLQKVPYCDLKVFEILFDFLPEQCCLHLANSSVVRYAQLFDPLRSVRYFSNRGTSGIDGSSSTAVGASMMDPTTWHVLVTGDVSFFYDSNAFWNAYMGPNLRIILINNGGGGIFKYIPGPSNTKQLNDYFFAQHQHNAKGICESYHLEYFTANSIESLEDRMQDFWIYEENGRPKLLEIDTTSVENENFLKAFFPAVHVE